MSTSRRHFKKGIPLHRLAACVFRLCVEGSDLEFVLPPFADRCAQLLYEPVLAVSMFDENAVHFYVLPSMELVGKIDVETPMQLRQLRIKDEETNRERYVLAVASYSRSSCLVFKNPFLVGVSTHSNFVRRGSDENDGRASASEIKVREIALKMSPIGVVDMGDSRRLLVTSPFTASPPVLVDLLHEHAPCVSVKDVHSYGYSSSLFYHGAIPLAGGTWLLGQNGNAVMGRDATFRLLSLDPDHEGGSTVVDGHFTLRPQVHLTGSAIVPRSLIFGSDMSDAAADEPIVVASEASNDRLLIMKLKILESLIGRSKPTLPITHLVTVPSCKSMYDVTVLPSGDICVACASPGLLFLPKKQFEGRFQIHEGIAVEAKVLLRAQSNINGMCDASMFYHGIPFE